MGKNFRTHADRPPKPTQPLVHWVQWPFLWLEWPGKGADQRHPAPSLESKAEPLLPLCLCGMLQGDLTFYYYYYYYCYYNADYNNTPVIKC
jgi:hypothetical protein